MAKKADRAKWIVGIAVPIVVALIGLVPWWYSRGEKETTSGFTYIGQVSIIENQYQQYLGKPLTDEGTKAQIQAAVNLASAGQFDASRRAFEELSKTVPVPAVLTSVGSFYAEAGNTEVARQYYEKAVAKDPAYRPALNSLKNLGSAGATGAATAEAEPNNDIPHANMLALRTATGGEASANSGPDFFQFITAGAPRDLYQVSIKNQSTTLAPGIRLYDGQKNLLTASYDARAVRDTPGADLDYEFAPPAGATYYVEVYPRNGSGQYAVTVSPLGRFDRLEPNDDIPSAKSVGLGSAVDANIMDVNDKDFYQVGATSAALTIAVRNTSTTLAPGVRVYDGQKNLLTASYDSAAVTDTPGANLTYMFSKAPGTYYVEIYPRANTAGSYSLEVR